MARYQLAETGAVDIRNPHEVQHNLPGSPGYQVPHGVAHRARPFAESKTAGNIDYAHVVHLAGIQFQVHEIQSPYDPASAGRFISAANFGQRWLDRKSTRL